MTDKIIVSSDNERIEIQDPNPLLKFDISSNGTNDTLELSKGVKATLETDTPRYIY